MVSDLEIAIKVMAGRWKPSIINVLTAGDRRFGELQRELVGIPHKMLIQRLRELDRDGVVQRQVITGGPRHVRYTLTASGRQLLPILELMRDWASRHQAGELQAYPM